MLTEEYTSGPFAEPTRAAVAVIRVEHDAATTGFELEDVGDHSGKQNRSNAAVDEPHVRDGGMHTDIVRVRGITRGDGILCRPVELDIAKRLAAKEAYEWPGVLAIELGL